MTDSVYFKRIYLVDKHSNFYQFFSQNSLHLHSFMELLTILT